MHIVKTLALAGTVSLALAGCNTAQVNSTLTQIGQDCASLEAGTSLVVAIATLGGPTVATIAQGVQAGAAACTALLPQIEAVIAQITDAGGTAVVTVSTTAPSGAKSVRRFGVRRGVAGPQVFTIPPNSLF